MDPNAHLPLKPVDLILLLALADEDRHGYALALEIEQRTDGPVHMEPGNLYRIIKRLLADDLVAESGRAPARDLGDERRRYYRITPLGRRVRREQFGTDMREFFHDRWHSVRQERSAYAITRFWLRVVLDLFVTAGLEYTGAVVARLNAPAAPHRMKGDSIPPARACAAHSHATRS